MSGSVTESFDKPATDFSRGETQYRSMKHVASSLRDGDEGEHEDGAKSERFASLGETRLRESGLH